MHHWKTCLIKAAERVFKAKIKGWKLVAWKYVYIKHAGKGK